MPCTAIKGQVLTDFVVEFTEDAVNRGKETIGVVTTSACVIPPWEVYTDGTANQKRARVRIVLVTPEKMVMEKSLWLGFLTTNNEAEYEALLAGMAIVSQLRGEMIELYFDSRLVVGQVNGEFEARDERMQGYLAKVKQARVHFRSFTLK